MIATNISGLVHMTRAILPRMVERDDGIILNLGSTAGDYPYPGGHVYGGTKAFVRQFSLNLRADLVGSNIRVTDIEPGMVGGSEFSPVRFQGDAARPPPSMPARCHSPRRTSPKRPPGSSPCPAM